MQQSRVKLSFSTKNGEALQCMCVAPTPVKADIFLTVTDDLETWFSKKDPQFG